MRLWVCRKNIDKETDHKVQVIQFYSQTPQKQHVAFLLLKIAGLFVLGYSLLSLTHCLPTGHCNPRGRAGKGKEPEVRTFSPRTTQTKNKHLALKELEYFCICSFSWPFYPVSLRRQQLN